VPKGILNLLLSTFISFNIILSIAYVEVQQPSPQTPLPILISLREPAPSSDSPGNNSGNT
jgi:hypothetical protein